MPSVLSSTAFWSMPAAERAATFAELRRTAPVSFHERTGSRLAPGDGGYWALTRHADLQHVSRAPALFSSAHGVGLGDTPVELLELNASFLVMDEPRHTALRRVVSGAFTPRRVAQLNDDVGTEAARIVDDLVERGGGEAVRDLSMKLPLWTISNLLGVPESMRAELYVAAEGQLSAQDPEYGGDGARVAVESARAMHRIAGELVGHRRTDPGDDILSALVHAELDGEPLSDRVLGGIFVLLATAGNDTTRQSTSHAMKLFAEHPDQWERLAADGALMAPAIEEIVRHATPVIHFRRTATADTEVAGMPIAEGDPVVMFYESANRDEAVFDDPDRFDIGRDPNPHVAFGGGGVHFCLGANLARAELRALLSRLVATVATIEVGPAEHLTSNFVNGIKRMPLRVTRR